MNSLILVMNIFDFSRVQKDKSKQERFLRITGVEKVALVSKIILNYTFHIHNAMHMEEK